MLIPLNKEVSIKLQKMKTKDLSEQPGTFALYLKEFCWQSGHDFKIIRHERTSSKVITFKQFTDLPTMFLERTTSPSVGYLA